MSSDGIDLALAFLQAHPDEAARLLEGESVVETASFIAGIPHIHAALVLSRMLPQYAARLCEQIASEQCAPFLSRMNTSHVASILRYSKAGQQKKIQACLPERMRIGCKVLLSYSEISVGAWMLPNVPALPVDCTVEDAWQRIKKEDGFIDLDCLYVLDRDNRLQGSVGTKALLMSGSATPLSSIMNLGPHFLYGSSALNMAGDNFGWETRDTMPVVNRNKQLVGIIRHLDLRRGMTKLQQPNRPTENEGLFFQVFGAYANCLVALFNTLGDDARKESLKLT